MQMWVIRLIAAVLVLCIFILVFSAAWTWMRRYDAVAKELAVTKKQLKDARDEMAALEDLLGGRTA